MDVVEELRRALDRGDRTRARRYLAKIFAEYTGGDEPGATSQAIHESIRSTLKSTRRCAAIALRFLEPVHYSMLNDMFANDSFDGTKISEGGSDVNEDDINDEESSSLIGNMNEMNEELNQSLLNTSNPAINTSNNPGASTSNSRIRNLSMNTNTTNSPFAQTKKKGNQRLPSSLPYRSQSIYSNSGAKTTTSPAQSSASTSYPYPPTISSISLSSMSNPNNSLSKGSMILQGQGTNSANMHMMSSFAIDITPHDVVIVLKIIRNLARIRDKTVREALQKRCGKRILEILLNGQWSKEPEIYSSCLAVFINLSSGHPQNIQTIMGELQISLPLINTLESFHNHADVQIMGLGLLFTLTSCDNFSNQYQLLAAGASDAILASMQTHIKNPDVVRAGCQALAQLPVDMNGRLQIIANGAIELVLIVMNTHLDVELVQLHALRSILNLFGNTLESVEKKIGNEMEMRKSATSNAKGASLKPAVAFSVSQTSSIGGDAKTGLGIASRSAASSSYTDVSPTMASKDMKDVLGGDSRTDTLKMQTSSSMITGGRNLPNSKKSFANQSENFIHSFPTIRTLRAVLNAMQNHQKSALVQQYGCRVLGVFAYESLINEKEQVIKTMNHEILGAVVAAIRGYSEFDVATCRFALASLCNIIPFCDFSEEVALAVIDSMGFYSKDAKVHEYGCRSLENMSMNITNYNLLQLIALGAGKTLTSAFRNFRSNEQVQEYAIGAVGEISKTTDFNVKLMLASEYNFVAEIIRSMQLHLYSPRIGYYGLRALCNLPTIGNFKCIEVTITVMTEHVKVARVQIIACSLLRFLAKGSCSDLINLEAHVAIMDAYRHHRHDPELAEVVCLALMSFLVHKNVQVARILRKDGALEIANQVISKFYDNKEALAAAHKLRSEILSTLPCYTMLFCNS